MGWARKELGIELNPFRVAESAMRKFGDVVQAIMNNPIPAILQIGGAMIGIPPYVTSAAITAVQGGDLKDIAKSAAVAYVTSDFLQNTQIGADIRNYTANVWSGDVTDFMIENFDISMDQAVQVAKISSAALTGAVSGGIRATLLGDSVGTGIASGFSSGLVYSSVDSYFDDLNKDPNWGLGPKTLNIIKGATSTGLNTIISGKGDPAQAIGNYIAYSTLKLGASEFKQTLQRAYDEHTGKTDEARNAQQAYLTVKAEYDAEVRRHDDLANEIRMQYQNYEADYARYTKIQSDLTRFKRDYDSASSSVNSLVNAYDVAVQRYNAGLDSDINYIIEAKETLDRLLPQYEEVAARSSQYFINVRDSTNTQAVLGRLEETKNTIAIKSDDLKAIKAKIETPENGNLAERLKFAAENYDKKYNLYKTSEEGVQKAAEVYNKTAAEIASRDFTIDAINSGALAVTEVAEDGSYRLDNGMTVKDGKFYQNGNPLFMDAAGVSQNNLEMKLPDGQVVRYGMNAGRQMSPTDVQNAFIRDYGVELSAAEARQFVGTGYGMYDVHKFEDFAKKKVNEAYKLIAGKDATAQQQQQFIKVPNSQNAAIQAAVVEKEPEIANNQAAIDTRNRVATEVLQGYRAQGMTPEQITERIDSGLAVDDLNEILETQKREVDNKIQKAQQLSQNRNSPEYKEAYRQALDAMSEYGGYGVNKEADGSYYYDNVGKIDPETLVPVNRSRFWTDPVTGRLHIHLVGVGSNDELIPAKDVSALWAIGKSGNPPSKGGEAVLGDGSGVQSGMPGPTLIAIDDGSGDKNAKMFDVGNGFALIAYSDGTRKLVKTDGTVFWMDTENADNAVKNLPVVTTPTLAINGGKEEVNVGEKAIGEFYSILTDPTLAEKLYPEKPTQQTPVTTPTVTPEAPPVVTPEVPVTPPGTPVTPPSVPETPVTPPVVPEAPVTPPVTPPVVPETPVTPPVVPEAPVTPPVTTPADPALQQLRNDVTAQIAAAQAQGKTELEAVQQAVDSVAANLGTTKEALLAQLGTTEAQLRSDVTTQVGGVENRLTAAIAAAQQAGQTGDAALQAGIAQVATDLGTTKEQLLAQVGKTEAQLRADMQTQVGGVESRLTAAIDAAKQSGMQGDAALQAGINQVATELGTTKEQLLSQIGKTEQQLRADVTGQISGVETRLRDAIAAAQQSGQTGDAALQAGINKVASDLGTTKDQLLAQVGKTEEQLRSDMQAQVSGVETRLTDAIEQARQSGLQGDAALQAGIDKVAADIGATKEQLLAQVGKTEAQLKADMQAQVGGVESRLAAAIDQARQSGLQGDAALQAGIDKVASDLNTTKDIVLEQVGKTEQQLRTDLAEQLGGVQQQIGQVQTDLTKAIADAKAAGATDVQAVRDALATVSTSLGTTQEALLQQLGKSEADLRAEFRAGQQSTQEQIENLGSTFMQQYDALNASQKSQFDALVEQGSNLRSAMDLVQTQTQEQLQNVETRLRDAMAANEAAGMSRDAAATKAIQDVATSVGTTKNELLAQVGKTEDVLRSELATGLAQTQEQIRSELQTQYDQLTASQKAQFDAMVEQGATLRTAMDLVRSEAQAAQEQTQQQIAQLDANTQTKFNQLSEAQQQQALDLAKASGDLTTAINNVAAETATQITGVETRLREAMEANEAAGLSRDEAANKAIQDVATSVGTSKEQLLSQLGKTEQTLRGELTAGLAGVQTGLETQIAGVQKNLNDAIAANEAAGLSRDEAITKSITDVATSLGTTKEALLAQMGTSEQNLRSELAAGLQATQQQLTEQMQAQYNSLSAAQKAEVDARVQQGQDLQAAIQGVSEQTQQQIAQSETALREAIGQLGTNVQGQFDQMSAAQKAEVAARVQQGQDLSAAIQSVGTQAAEQIAQTETALRQAIGQLGTDVQGQFNAMDAAQKAEVAARVQQGQDLQTAIANVGTATAQQIAQSETALRDAIGQLGTNVQGQFDLMSSAQKAEVAARVQQGQDLQTAIQTVGTQTQEQIAASEAAMRQALGQLGTDVQSQFDQMSQAQQTEVAARVQQGQDLQAAIQNVGQQASQQLSAAQTALQGQITTLGEDLQRQYNEMSDAQRDEVAQRVQMGQQIDTAITNVGLQIGEVEEKLTINVEDLRKQIEAENARKAAFDKSTAQRQAQQKTLELGQQSVGTPGGAAEGPLPQAQFRGPLSTGEAKETEFKGPLEDFLKKVETTSYTASPGQAMQQTQQTAQSQQAQQPAQPGSNYYSYGVFNEIDQILNPLAGAMPSIFGAKEGGLATPMFAQGGLNVVHHAGKARMDFRQGAAVNGPGDGQSDDIPAMLADGEFVFPADVVSALGNGSTKAGSDKLYDMMHSIRSYHRSAKPQDLPPPAKKSPLDYLKKARR